MPQNWFQWKRTRCRSASPTSKSKSRPRTKDKGGVACEGFGPRRAAGGCCAGRGSVTGYDALSPKVDMHARRMLHSSRRAYRQQDSRERTVRGPNYCPVATPRSPARRPRLADGRRPCPLVVDFACCASRLVVEVDASAHQASMRQDALSAAYLGRCCSACSDSP